MSKHRNILPDDFYGDAPQYARDMYDTEVRMKLPDLPFKPGKYTDPQGSVWTINEDGTWTDSSGETRPIEWNPMLAMNCPYTPL